MTNKKKTEGFDVKPKYKVLVIEDEKDSMNCVKRSLPDNCEILPEIESKFYSLCKKGLDGSLAGQSFKENIKDLIEKNFRELRAIVCDLKLGETEDAGERVIEWIRSAESNGIDVRSDFLKFIPIIIYTHETATKPKQRSEALSRGANTILIKKDDVVSRKDRIDVDLQNVLKKDIEVFQCLYEHYIFNGEEKKYKVALSFTGREENAKGTEEHRDFVREIAKSLYGHFTKTNVFYDEDQGINGWTKEKFEEHYANDCKYIFVCLSDNYAKKSSPWTQKEWDGIKRYCEKNADRVIFLAIGDVKEEKFKELGIEPRIWENMYELRERFYKLLHLESDEIKSSFDKMRMFDLTKNDFGKIYNKRIIEMRKSICVKIDDLIRKNSII